MAAVSNSAQPLTTLTFIRSRNAKMWVVVECRKEMFIRCPDITHPFQQVFCLATIKCIIDESAAQCRMSGAFGNQKFVRRFLFQRRRSPVLISPNEHGPHNRATKTIYSLQVENLVHNVAENSQAQSITFRNNAQTLVHQNKLRTISIRSTLLSLLCSPSNDRTDFVGFQSRQAVPLC